MVVWLQGLREEEMGGAAKVWGKCGGRLPKGGGGEEGGRLGFGRNSGPNHQPRPN
jgi:hypothetical protein